MTESSRRHDRNYFYKYMPADTARKVLISGRLRWSSPLLFNDPFDVPREIAHGFDSTDIARAVGDLLSRYLDRPPDDLTNFDETLAQVLKLAKRGFPRELKEQLRAVIPETVKELNSEGNALRELRRHWAALVPTMRILCLTESPNHVAMWHHYADRYRGVVMGLRCSDERDNFLLVAEPIQYLAAKPDVYTDEGLARLICLTSLAAANETIHLAVYTKSDDWSYEKEWRILSYADAVDPAHYSDRKFDRADLCQLYFGPLIHDRDRQAILDIISDYPSLEVFHAAIGMDRELHFRRNEI